MSETKKRKFHGPEFKVKLGLEGIAKDENDQRDRPGMWCSFQYR
jgi:hypothetical protein